MVLQALPCTMAMIKARPDLRENHTQGVLVAEYKILYEKFDNMQAAGW